jgi:hypothetical protein
MGFVVASGKGIAQLPAAGFRTVTPVTRRRYIPVGSTKTYMDPSGLQDIRYQF